MAGQELRCPNRLHGILKSAASGLYEVKCPSGFCGSGKGVTVLHTFDLSTATVVSTQRYRTPNTERKVNGISRDAVAIRSA